MAATPSSPRLPASVVPTSDAGGSPTAGAAARRRARLGRWRRDHRRGVKDAAVILAALIFIPAVALLGMTLLTAR
jgi:hypothetical protein